MKNWTEEEWAEWRCEREGILIYDAGFSKEDAVRYAKTLQALEKLRIRLETPVRGHLRPDVRETHKPITETEMPVP